MSSTPLVAHVIPTLAPYGAEHLAVELSARLPSHGFRTRLVVLFDEGALWDDVRRRDIRWTPIGSRSQSRLSLVSALRAKLFSEPERTPDIIHTHLFGSDVWMNVARLVERAVNPREVHPTRYVSTAHNVDRDDSSMRRAARRWAVRRMDRVIAISHDVERYLREDLGVSPKRIQTIPNGIDMTRLPLRSGGAFKDTPRLLMVGRLEIQKGHETALKALAQVDAPWRMDIVGSGSLERELKELCERLGIASRVQFLGERKDVPLLLAQTDLLLFPSRWEGMGLALLEALAAGVPVLASDLPAIRELVPAESRIDADSVTSWHAAIKQTLYDPVPSVHRAQKLAPTIAARYSVDEMVKRYAEVYRTLLR